MKKKRTDRDKAIAFISRTEHTVREQIIRILVLLIRRTRKETRQVVAEEQWNEMTGGQDSPYDEECLP